VINVDWLKISWDVLHQLGERVCESLLDLCFSIILRFGPLSRSAAPWDGKIGSKYSSNLRNLSESPNLSMRKFAWWWNWQDNWIVP